MNFKSKLLKYLKKNLTITKMEAGVELNQFNLGEYIRRLRADGHNISTDMGRGYAVYRLNNE